MRYAVRMWDFEEAYGVYVTGDNHTETSFTYQPATSGHIYFFVVYPVNSEGQNITFLRSPFLTMP